MTDRRIELHSKLCDLLGSNQVYFQPPESVRMKYPAIVYSISFGNVKYANNNAYLLRRRYAVTIIDKDPDACWYEKMQEAFDYCYFERAYAAENLNHWQFSLFY